MNYGNPSVPVVFRGEAYPSHSALARKLGCHRTTVDKAVRAGRVDEIGRSRTGRPLGRVKRTTA